MPTDIVIKHFDGRPVPFRMESGNLTLTMRDAGELLQYRNKPAEYVGRLYASHKDEFDNDCTFMSCIGGSVNQPPQRERIFTLDGLILLCMFSEQPVAKKVRKWLRKIGREVAETGSYNSLNSATLTKILDGFNETMLLQGRMLQNLSADVAEMRQERSRVLIPAQPDNTYWPTPAERVRTLISSERIPKYFNRGGSFNIYASLRHARLHDGLFSQRNRRHLGKMPDYVVQPCPEMDQFLRETFEIWLKRVAPKQAKLRLAPVRTYTRRGHRVLGDGLR